MVLQASHTWRGRLSPAGTLRLTGAPQLEQKFIEANAESELKYALYDTSSAWSRAVDMVRRACAGARNLRVLVRRDEVAVHCASTAAVGTG
jgi:hypothetical protein